MYVRGRVGFEHDSNDFVKLIYFFHHTSSPLATLPGLCCRTWLHVSIPPPFDGRLHRGVSDYRATTAHMQGDKTTRQPKKGGLVMYMSQGSCLVSLFFLFFLGHLPFSFPSVDETPPRLYF